MMQQTIKQYNEKQLALVQQITKASRREIIAAAQLAQVRLEEIIQCLTKSKASITVMQSGQDETDF